jgi:hypothetical protein
MSAIYRHGMRHELLPRVEATNPMKYVRQSGKRQSIPVVLEVEQFQSLFGALQQRERTMVLLDCGSGLRCGELIGPQWRDIDFARKQMSTDGQDPTAALVLGTDGNFYGTTATGGAGGCGGSSTNCGQGATRSDLEDRPTSIPGAIAEAAGPA